MPGTSNSPNNSSLHCLSILKNISFLTLFQNLKNKQTNLNNLSRIHTKKMAPEIVSSAVPNGLAKAASLPSRAYVTFLAGNGDYVKGVVGLAKGLRKVKTAYPLVVAVLPDVPEEHRRILVNQGCIVREIEPVYPPENQTQFAMAYYVINYSKLRIWEFVEYSKMIYLDGDIQVYENIDHLFDLPDGYFYAVKDCFCEKTWSHTPQYKIGYCQQCPDKVQWPEELGPKPPLYFNAGMFVYEPSLPTYDDLLRTLEITPPTPFAEQDFLNMFFRDVYRPIPPIYNLVLAMLWRHPENVELEKVKVVHYCAAGSKPWRYTGQEQNMDREDIKMLVKKWWDIYDDETLDHKRSLTSSIGTAAATGIEAEAQTLKSRPARYIAAPSAA
ncbi:galactinol synthase 2-like [Coffea arabica]|uniref:Hexosyltransferase n=1 Tax=Coffea arabica TaxID=13443 RepID=A0A6P6WH94_COFAR|nr:galactinol synthase 2-like [Coffea arabica]